MQVQEHMTTWSQSRAQAELICARSASLMRDHGVMLRYLGRPLIGYSSAQLLSLVARTVPTGQAAVDIPRLAEIVDALWDMRDQGLMPCRFDIASLSSALPTGADLVPAMQALPGLIDTDTIGQDRAQRDVVLYGFGRIGRLLARLLMDRHGAGTPLVLRAIVLRPAKVANDLEKRAALLERDSVHGAFDGQVDVDEDGQRLIINGWPVQVIYASNPEDINYADYGLTDPLVIDNTGVFKTREDLGRHLGATTARQVLLTAPAKGDVPNVVYGINEHEIDDATDVSCAASCTTNAAAPILDVMNRVYGISSGHLETVHAYTNDQNLIDNFHKAERRGRAAPLNLVITSTGAAKAVAKVIPELAGKLTGNAIRVPTPNVSLVIMNLELSREVTPEEVNDMLLQESRTGRYSKQIGFTREAEVVSSDFVGSRSAGIVDARATLGQGRHVTLYVWYDNEYGYSNQVLRVAARLTGSDIPTITAG